MDYEKRRGVLPLGSFHEEGFLIASCHEERIVPPLMITPQRSLRPFYKTTTVHLQSQSIVCTVSILLFDWEMDFYDLSIK
jgi:hypothetical protein